MAEMRIRGLDNSPIAEDDSFNDGPVGYRSGWEDILAAMSGKLKSINVRVVGYNNVTMQDLKESTNDGTQVR